MPGLVKGPWNAEEDEVLARWVTQEGPLKWSKCSAKIPGRSGKQCRERWMHSLCPDVKKGNWTSEEDQLILKLYNEYGPRWSLIWRHVAGRTENSVKNRFYSMVRRLQSPKPEAAELNQTDPFEKMADLLAQMHRLESILKATKTELAFLEGKENAVGPKEILS
jgi:hypothetical protein